MESQINTILSDTNFEQTVTFHYSDGNVSKLVFTDFFYEETANEEAVSSIIKPMVPEAFTGTVSAVRASII